MAAVRCKTLSSELQARGSNVVPVPGRTTSDLSTYHTGRTIIFHMFPLQKCKEMHIFLFQFRRK